VSDYAAATVSGCKQRSYRVSHVTAKPGSGRDANAKYSPGPVNGKAPFMTAIQERKCSNSGREGHGAEYRQPKSLNAEGAETAEHSLLSCCFSCLNGKDLWVVVQIEKHNPG
jgi:hypothetical protein